MSVSSDTVCIILAGGQGKRMASAERHKVCFPIVGRPAIIRAIDAYKAAGLRRFMVVVGQMAEQVLQTIADAHPEVTFIYQPQPRGTGHAAAVAGSALAAQGFAGTAMIVMGDKVTRPATVRALLEHFDGGQFDMVLASIPKEPGTSAGRVVEEGEQVLGIVEMADIRDIRQRRARICAWLGGGCRPARSSSAAPPSTPRCTW